MILKGVKVIDLTHAYNGPFCTMHLADHGAEVIKIERPGSGDQSREWPPVKNGESGYYAFLNRNKKGMTLNLRSDKGKEVFEKLLSKADVLVENFRPGTLQRLGYSWDRLNKEYPRLIYAQGTGFGTYGPLSPRRSYDVIAQGMGGMMSLTGFPDNPPTKAGVSIADNFTGTYLALGIAMALYYREKTGKGQRIEVSMQDTVFSILENAVVEYTMAGKILGRQGNVDPGIAPFDLFECKDGFVIIAIGSDVLWARFCEIIGHPELSSNPSYKTNIDRVNNYLPELKKIIEDWTSSRTESEAEKIMLDNGIPAGHVMNVKEITEHPHTKVREMIVEIDHPKIGRMKIPGIPIKFEQTPGSVREPAPLLGQHTESILKEIGYSNGEIQGLREGDAF
jgi:CoA:oxalate CoA-transferase